MSESADQCLLLHGMLLKGLIVSFCPSGLCIPPVKMHSLAGLTFAFPLIILLLVADVFCLPMVTAKVLDGTEILSSLGLS